MSPISFGHYLLLHRLALSKMSEIYLARPVEPRAGHPLVVLKLLRPEAQRDPELVKMFVDEEAILGRLDHPHIIRALDFGKAQDRYFIALEHVWGESLTSVSALCRRRQLVFPLAAALHVGAVVADALDHAHTRLDPAGRPSPIYHRDVTLNNIMLGYDGQVRVVDFGMAKAVGRLAETSVGQVKGTLAYLAPEQIRSGPIGPQTDIYQLGVVLYKVMVGRDPVAGKDMGELVDAILAGRVVPPSQVIGNFPRPVEHVLLKALATAPEQRYPSARQLAQALQGMLPEEFGDGREPIASFLQRVAGERYQKQAAFVAQVAGREVAGADLEELFQRPSEDDAAADVPVETSAVMKLDGSLPQGLDSSDELPWASAILMIEPAPVGTETPASVDELLDPPAPARAFAEVWAERLQRAREAGRWAGRRAGEVAGPLVQRAVELGKQGAAAGLELGKQATAAGLEFGKKATVTGVEQVRRATAAGVEFGKRATSSGVELGRHGAARGLGYLRGLDWNRVRQAPGRAAAALRELAAHPERLRSPRAIATLGAVVAALIVVVIAAPRVCQGPPAGGPVVAAVVGEAGEAGEAAGATDDTGPARDPARSVTPDAARAAHAVEVVDAGRRAKVDAGGRRQPPEREVSSARARKKAERAAARRRASRPEPAATPTAQPADEAAPTGGGGEAQAIRQLREGRTCDERKLALEQLGRIGSSERALAAIQEAGRRQPDNMCMVFAVTVVEGKVRQRMGL